MTIFKTLGPIHTAAIFGAFITAVLFLFLITSQASAFLADAELETRREAIVSCANFKVPSDVARQTLVDADSGVVYVKWLGSDGVVNTTVLPYKPGDIAALRGCSKEAKDIMLHAQQAHEALVADTCKDFREIIAGQKPLPEKNGKKANMQGAVNFVNQYCK